MQEKWDQIKTDFGFNFRKAQIWQTEVDLIEENEIEPLAVKTFLTVCWWGITIIRLKSNTLATWCEELTHWKRPWCWERLKVKGERGDRMRWLDSIIVSMDMNLSKLWERVEDRGAWYTIVHGVTRSQTWLTNWTTITTKIKLTFTIKSQSGRAESGRGQRWGACVAGCGPGHWGVSQVVQGGNTAGC